MGEFETTSRTKTVLPDSLPSAKDAAAEHHDGAVYKITEDGADKGRRFRLRHARWVEVVARSRGTAKETTKAAAQK